MVEMLEKKDTRPTQTAEVPEYDVIARYQQVAQRVTARMTQIRADVVPMRETAEDLHTALLELETEYAAMPTQIKAALEGFLTTEDMDAINALKLRQHNLPFLMSAARVKALNADKNVFAYLSDESNKIGREVRGEMNAIYDFVEKNIERARRDASAAIASSEGVHLSNLEKLRATENKLYGETQNLTRS